MKRLDFLKELKIYDLGDYIFNNYSNKIKETEKYQFINYFYYFTS